MVTQKIITFSSVWDTFCNFWANFFTVFKKRIWENGSPFPGVLFSSFSLYSDGSFRHCSGTAGIVMTVEHLHSPRAGQGFSLSSSPLWCYPRKSSKLLWRRLTSIKKKTKNKYIYIFKKLVYQDEMINWMLRMELLQVKLFFTKQVNLRKVLLELIKFWWSWCCSE